MGLLQAVSEIRNIQNEVLLGIVATICTQPTQIIKIYYNFLITTECNTD